MKRAFTLVEVVLAFAIFTGVITLVLVSMVQTFRSFQEGERFADRIQKQRLTFMQMARDINSLVKIRYPDQRCASFEAGEGSFSFIMARPNALAEVRYECNSIESSLNRYIQEPSDYEYNSWGEKKTCLAGLVECRFSYGNGDTWKSTWKQDTQGIPRMVRLQFRGEKDPETKEFIAHIPVSQ